MNDGQVDKLVGAVLIAGLAISIATYLARPSRYQMVSHGNLVIVMDSSSGQSWRRLQTSEGEPTTWRQDLPLPGF